MQAISLWLAAAIVILTGWAIVKKYQVNMAGSTHDINKKSE